MSRSVLEGLKRSLLVFDAGLRAPFCEYISISIEIGTFIYSCQHISQNFGGMI